jgi:hypothetical protein
MTQQEIIVELERIRERINVNALHSPGGVHELLDGLIEKLGARESSHEHQSQGRPFGSRS